MEMIQIEPRRSRSGAKDPRLSGTGVTTFMPSSLPRQTVANTDASRPEELIESPARSTPSSPRRRRWLSSLTIFGFLAVGLFSLSPRLFKLIGDHPAVASLSSATTGHLDQLAAAKPRLLTKPIEEIRCGDRIPSELPEGLSPDDEPEPDPATWRLVELELTKKNGDKVEVKLIRPLAWLEQAGAIRNGTFPIKVEELDIEGEAAVLRILPCPPISTGRGQVVTGTFRHTCDDFVELQIEGEPSPIVCTSGHQFWSESRKQFVRADSFKPADQLRTPNFGTAIIRHVVKTYGDRAVFNLEVAGSHTYFVGAKGLVVHNATPAPDENPARYDGRNWRDPATGRFAVDPWSRAPENLQDMMTLESAKRGAGTVIIPNLGDSRFLGWEKVELIVKSDSGAESVVHYVRNPLTGETADFKFTKHARAGTSRLGSTGRRLKTDCD